MITPSAGCQNLTAVNLTAAQGTTAPSTVCQQDRTAQYSMYSPEVTRIGANSRFTANISDRIQAYAMFNFAETKTYSSGSNAASPTRRLRAPPT
jgi:iron complex outermembrane receptor protein